MNKFTKILWMLYFTFLLVFGTAHLKSVYANNLYVQSKSLAGFDLTETMEKTKNACKNRQATWTESTKPSDEAAMVFVCEFKKQDARLLQKPKDVSFVFNGGRMVLADFRWSFNAWAKREDVKRKFQGNMKNKFLMGVKKLEKEIYLLRTVDYVLVFVGEDHEEENVYDLHVLAFHKSLYEEAMKELAK